MVINGIAEAKCSCCNKQIFMISPTLYVYKQQGKYFCSYHCLREYEKNKETKVDRRKIRK